MQRAYLFKAAAVATLSIAAVTASASTAQAQDRLNFEGSANVRDLTPGGGGDQLLIDFLTNGQTPGGTTGTVTAIQTIGAGFMPGVMVGTVGTISDLTTTSAGFTVPAPGGTILTIGGYTFSLTGAPSGNAFGPISLFNIGGSTTAAFGVSGTVMGGNFGMTPRNYQGVFTAQFAGETPDQVFNSINSGGTRSVSFSAEFVVAPAQVIPEPSTYVLMASGLGALAMAARRRRAQS